RLAFALDARHVVLLDPLAGKVIWTSTLPGSSTLTGQAPRLIGRGRTLLVLVQRNYGATLTRLDFATGKPAWRKEILLHTEKCDSADFAENDGVVFLIGDRRLTAYDLSEGKRLWERSLAGPKCTWRVMVAGDYLTVFPERGLVTRFQFRCAAGTLEW